MKKTLSLSAPQVWWVLAVLGFVIYSNTFSSSFVFDDFQAIVNNPSIRRLDFFSLWQAFNTRFVVGLSLAFNYALGKDNVVGYHALNTLLHIFNSFFVYQLVCLTFGTPRMSKSALGINTKLIGFLTALLFLTHPVQTQAVTYIWQRATSLATFFYLGALVFYIQARFKNSGINYWLSFLFTVLGMFTKEIVFTLPFMILLYEFIFLSFPKSLIGDHSRFDSRLKISGMTLLALIPILATLFIIPWTMTQASDETLKFLRPNNTHFNPGHEKNLVKSLLQMTRSVSDDRMPRRDFILTELNVLRTYLRLFVLPINQSVDYDYPRARSLLEANTFFSFLLLVSLLGAAALVFKKHPLLAFGIFWFFLTVSVESLVAQEEFIFEHRLYLPMAGLSLFLVMATVYFFKNKPRVPAAALLGIAAIFSFLTFQRNFVWKNEFTLWDDAIKHAPHKGRPYNNRGYAYEKMGLFEKALEDSNKVIKINPNATMGYNNRGVSYKDKGDIDLALLDFNKAIELQPDNAEAYSNRGSLYEKKGLLDKALADCSKAITLAPAMANAYSNRSLIYRKKGLLDQALADCDKAIQLESHNAEAYSNRALVLENKGLWDQALADCDKAIKINPKMASAYINRAVVYEKRGLLDQALGDFNKAIKLEPRNVEAYINRASIHEKKGFLDQALADCNQALLLDAKAGRAYNNRGVCYKKKGLLDQALSDFNRAIELEANNADAYNNRGSVYGLKNLLNEALGDFNRAIELKPGFPEAYNNRAVLYFLKNEYGKSRLDVAKAQSLGFTVSSEVIEKLKKVL